MIGAIIQARMGSSRLPGKIMINVCGKTFLEHLIERIQDSKTIEKVIVATTTNKEDDVIEEFCIRKNILYYRGSQDDLLLRYKMAADLFNLDVIVRLTSDTPILEKKLLDKIVNVFINNESDFVSNVFPLPRTYPDGVNVEVFSKKILDEMHENSKKPSEREHVTFYVLSQPEKYNIIRVDLDGDYSKFRFNLDYKEDSQLLKILFERFYEKNKEFTVFDCIEFLEKNPDIRKINSEIVPFQGILKTFDEDKKQGFSEDKKFFNL